MFWLSGSLFHSLYERRIIRICLRRFSPCEARGRVILGGSLTIAGMKSVIARAASRRPRFGKRSSMRTKAMTGGSDNAVIVLGVRPIRANDLLDRSAQHLGRSDRARARQAIGALLAFTPPKAA